MSARATPFVECEQVHACLLVSDIPAAVEFYTHKLGFKLGFTWGNPPTFAGVNLGNTQMFLMKGAPEPKGCTVSFVVGNADELYEFHRTKASKSLSLLPTENTESAITLSATCTDTTFHLGTICSMPDRQLESSEWTFRFDWKSVWPLY